MQNTIVTVIGLAIVLAMIPLTAGNTSIKWVFSIVFLIGIFAEINIYGLHLGGLGMATNLMKLFPDNVNESMFIGWLFFAMLGLLGFIGGIMAISSSE